MTSQSSTYNNGVTRLSHLEVDRQVPLEGDFVDQTDLWFAGICAFVGLPFLFWALENINKRKKLKWLEKMYELLLLKLN